MARKKNGQPNHVRDLRIGAGMHQAELASELGVSVATVQNWESESTDMTGYSLAMLCDFFGVTPAEVYGDGSVSDDWRMRVELMDIYCNMSDEGRLALVSAARGMEKAFRKSRREK